MKMWENAHFWTFFHISLLYPNVPKRCCKFHKNTITKTVIFTFECLSTIIVTLQLDCQFGRAEKEVKLWGVTLYSYCGRSWWNLRFLSFHISSFQRYLTRGSSTYGFPEIQWFIGPINLRTPCNHGINIGNRKLNPSVISIFHNVRYF